MKNSKSKSKRILTAAQIKAIVERFAKDMSKQYGNLDTVAFIGIRTRGPYIAKRLAETIKKHHGTEIPIGEMDITLYRDDLRASRSISPTRLWCCSTTCSIPVAPCARRSII
jgi:pyrimidine operon attenuation protein/uracil phosphoribosyltransferase